MVTDLFKLEIFIPRSHFETLREALSSSGAGHLGNYDSCLSWSAVSGCWRPLKGSSPYNGIEGVLCEAEEYKVEVCCSAEKLRDTVSAIRSVHPYEEPVINIIALTALKERIDRNQYYEVRVEADFAAAHYLENYHGKCENLHGHNYRVLAHARGDALSEGGMLLDFGVLKKALREVCESLDHRNLNDLAVFAGNPSAERIAAHIFRELKQRLPEAPLSAVDVYETPGSRARYGISEKG